MKKYSSVFQLESELIAAGFAKDKDVFIPANCEPDTLTDANGNILYSYPGYKAYYIGMAK